jgi:hypothetical protein
MPSAAELRLLRSLSRLYDVMLRAYPSAFRREYRHEMALAFRDHAREIVEHQGSLALMPFMLNVIRDWAATVTQERLDMDTTQKLRLNRVSTLGLIVLSLTALMMVLPFVLFNLMTGHVPPPQTDEGTVIHIFQLAIVALVPVGLIFLVTADWAQPLRSMRRLALPAAMVLLAFSLVFYVEQIYYPSHGYPPPRPGLPARALHRILAAL